jgi:hypothetical protein
MKKVPSTGDMQKIAVAKKKVRRKIAQNLKAANVITLLHSSPHPTIHLLSWWERQFVGSEFRFARFNDIIIGR